MLSALRRWRSLPLHVSAYDINCQYRKKIKQRMSELKETMKEITVLIDGNSVQLQYFPNALHPFPPTILGIGKFHLPAHDALCRYKFAFQYLPGVGQTDGEALERIWAVLNSLARRTRDMAAGHRHDIINYFYGAMNTVRSLGLGE